MLIFLRYIYFASLTIDYANMNFTICASIDGFCCCRVLFFFWTRLVFFSFFFLNILEYVTGLVDSLAKRVLWTDATVRCDC